MRTRLLVVLSVLSLLVVAGFALPLLIATSAARTQQFFLVRSADLDRFATYAERADTGDGTVVLTQEVHAHTRLFGEGIVVVDGARRPLVESGLRTMDPGVGEAVDAALRNQPTPVPARITPWSDDTVLLWRPVGTGTSVHGAVVMRGSTGVAARDVAGRWLWVIAGAVAAAVSFAALAVVLARWVLRPVRELADGLGEVAAGRAGAHVSPSGGPPELRELASTFNRMSDAVRTSADQQRRLVADTSHQLRNPLAALRLRVDTLESQVAPPGQVAYRSALAEMERLEALLDGLLDLAAAESGATDRAASGDADAARAEIGEVVASRVDVWGPVADSSRVTVRAAGTTPAVARCTAAELQQLLDVLIDNAIRYGGPDATVSITWSSGHGRVHLAVSDDGPGLSASDRAAATRRFWRGATGDQVRGSGLGLAIADQLAGARGGRLTLGEAPEGGLRVEVELPCA
ncbi:MAG TPA: HAMP domain-containing sensor histidine kinase [Pseudonocardia sp.]|jgi:signal transduction histidine kinase|nr:HAMP domain-containing sensor histidine kinase [Pseudonocardia sp.]